MWYRPESGTQSSPDQSSSPSSAPPLCLMKTFNLQSLISTKEISCLFLGLVVRIKWDNGNECKRPIQMQGIVITIIKAMLCLTPSTADLNFVPFTSYCWIWASISTFLSLSPGFLLEKQILDCFIPSLLLNKCVYCPVYSNISVASYREKRLSPRKMCHFTGNLGLICTRGAAHGNLFENDKVL